MEIHHACINSEPLAKCGFRIVSAVNADDNEENCNAALIAPALSMILLILTNLSLPLVISRQGWTPLAQTPGM
jgi:hypothetical protein